jgi:hypothetical protein
LQDAVANFLGFQSTWSVPPDEAIGRIDIAVSGRDFGTKPIGMGKYDLPNQLLGRPSIPDKVVGEIVN